MRNYTNLPKTFLIISSIVFIILGACVGSTSALNTEINLPSPISKINILHQLHSTKSKSVDNYLIVGINPQDAQIKTELVSAWLVSFNSNYTKMYLQGLPITPTLVEQFTLSPDTLIAYIETLTDKNISANFTLTSKQFMWIINEIGGIKLSNKDSNGQTAYTYIYSANEPNTTTMRQAEVLQEMINTLEHPTTQFNINKYKNYLQPAVSSTIDIKTIIDNFFPINSKQIHVNVISTQN